MAFEEDGSENRWRNKPERVHVRAGLNWQNSYVEVLTPVAENGTVVGD